ncbi:MAG: acyltransferase [Oscillospiraceae bacterium]|nr:acyltransferase [Oscillospiraceae bacterium]
MTPKREYGLDLLRIISMMGIVSIHILAAGDGRGPMYDPAPTSILLQILCFLSNSSVNLFAMLSGYLYAPKQKIRSGNLISLLVNLEAYSLVITIVLFVFSSSFLVDAASILGSLFPMTTGAYWYLTSYILVFLLIPWLNRLIKHINRQQFAALLVMLFCLFCLVPTLSGKDYFVIAEGYSPFWLIYCYLIGGFIRLHRDWIGARIRRFWYPVLLCMILVIAAGCYLLTVAGLVPQFLFSRLSLFVSPLCLGTAVVVMLLFLDIRIPWPSAQRIVQTLSDAAFDVYVIHCHHLFYDIFIRGNFDFLPKQSPTTALLMLLALLIGFYLVCTLSCLIRKFLFRVLGIDALVRKAGDRVDALQEKLWRQTTEIS